MDTGLADKRVLITAGASGIGLAAARAFQAEGAAVMVCDIDPQALERAAAEGFLVEPCDVSDRPQVAQLFEAVTQRLGGLDILINNAGVSGPTAAVEDMDPEAWDRVLAVNITGMFNVTRLAVPLLKAGREPAIVNLSSGAGRAGFPKRTPYVSSKWAIVGFTKTISRELGPFGVRVNVVLPGPVAGERAERVIAAKAAEAGVDPDVVRDAMLQNQSIRRLISPERVADTIVFLCSRQASDISGESINVDLDTQALV